MPRSKWFDNRKDKKKRTLLPTKKSLRLMTILGILMVVLTVIPIFYIARSLPNVNDLPNQLSYSTFIYSEDGSELIASLNGTEYRVKANFESVPKYLKEAFIATEDERFYQHFGIDFRAIFRAMTANLSDRSWSQGGSTITQQIAKNVYLTRKKTIIRKLQEWILAIRIEQAYSKESILEMYLDHIFLGYNAYGVEAAAHHYFGKSVEQLTLAESAMLAGIAKAPNALSPRSNFDQAKLRQITVLNLMQKNGYISQTELETAKAENLKIVPIENQKYQYPYFVDYVLKELLEIYGSEMVYRGGLTVYTTIDTVMQKEAEKAISEILDKALPIKEGVAGPEVALISMNPNNGYIKAIVGGRTHEHVLGLNRTEQPRQPGSVFKPIAVFAPAIANGYSPETVIKDAPIELKVGSTTWSPKNYNNRYLGPIPLREAAARSINTVAVRLIADLGVDTAISSIKNLGITTLELSNPRINDTGPAIALGGLTKGVTPKELNSAYGVFASGGKLVEPIAILKVIDRSGNILLDNKPQVHPVIDPGVAFLITDMLKDSITKKYGTAARYGNIGRPAAAKTGTSEKIRDAWFVGYTPELVTTVWMGYDKDKTMDNVYGGSYPAKIWNRVMRAGHRNIPIHDFPVPDNVVKVRICRISGKIPGDHCASHIVTGWFLAGKEPHSRCNVCVRKRIPVSAPKEPESTDPQPGDTIGAPYDPNQYFNPQTPNESDTTEDTDGTDD
jgi:penicillin-binding protein 1A